jgi:hypothetical protein
LVRRTLAATAGALIRAIPLGSRKILEGVDARAAALRRLGFQSLVVFLRRLEAVWTHDGLAR